MYKRFLSPPRRVALLVVVAGLICAPRGFCEGDIQLSDASLKVQVSRQDGSLRRLAMVGGDQDMLANCIDRYCLMSETNTIKALEVGDRVVSVSQPDPTSVVLLCENSKLSGIQMEKTYRLVPEGVLSKAVRFISQGESAGFVTYEAGSVLSAPFREEARWTGFPSDYTARFTEVYRRPASDQPYGAGLVTSARSGFGIGSYRFKVDGRFVWYRNIVDNPKGWMEKVFTQWLAAGKSVSGEVRWFAFRGDFITFQRHRVEMPEWRELWPSRAPAWVDRTINDIMYVDGKPSESEFAKQAEPFYVTDTIWFLNPPWGNWGPDDDPPLSWHHDVYGIAPNLKKSAPNVKVSAYSNGYLIDENSNVFRDHPEFVVTGKDGKPTVSPIPSDAKKALTYYIQRRAQGANEFFIEQYKKKLAAWDLDFAYVDGPMGMLENPLPDWRLKTVAQEYDWWDFYHKLGDALRLVKKDAVIFTNGMTPFTEIGYLEWWADDWRILVSDPRWRSLAFTLLNWKINQPENFLVFTLYGEDKAEPAYTSYSINYGWGRMGRSLKSLPYARAAWEMRRSQLRERAVSPAWWLDSTSTLEAYGMSNGHIASVNMISHNSAPSALRVQAQLDTLGLRTDIPLYSFKLSMNDPLNSTGSKAFTESALSVNPAPSPSLVLETEGRPGILEMLQLTNIPLFLKSVSGLESETGVFSHPDVQVTTEILPDKTARLKVSLRVDTAEVVVSGLTPKASAEKPVESKPTSFRGAPATLLTLCKGDTEILLNLEQKP
jgi:hypothetical protein